jgi:hypothetical protein
MNDKTEKDVDKDRELNEYYDARGEINDPVLLILRVHLFIEYMLERIIIAGLCRGDRVIEKARLSFVQKLVLVSSFDNVPSEDITVIRNLNTVRNRCAHERKKEITMADIELIGRPLGKEFTKFRKENHDNIVECLRRTLDTLCGGLCATTHYIEADNESQKK